MPLCLSKAEEMALKSPIINNGCELKFKRNLEEGQNSYLLLRVGSLQMQASVHGDWGQGGKGWR